MRDKMTEEMRDAIKGLTSRFEELLSMKSVTFWITVGIFTVLIVGSTSSTTLQKLVDNSSLTEEDIYDLVSGRIVVSPSTATHSTSVQVRLPDGSTVWGTKPVSNSTDTEVIALQLMAENTLTQGSYTATAESYKGVSVDKVYEHGFPPLSLSGDAPIELVIASSVAVTITGGILVFKRRRKTKLPHMVAIQ
jgi:hypothetical protein